MSPQTYHLKRGLIVALLGTILTARGTPDGVFQSAGNIPPTRQPVATQTAQPASFTPTPQIVVTTPTPEDRPSEVLFIPACWPTSI